MMSFIKKGPPPEGEATSSPDFLVAPPKRGEGVRRLNKTPLFIAGGIMTVAGLVFVYSLNERAARQHAGPIEGKKDKVEVVAGAGAPIPEALEKAPKAGIVPIGGAEAVAEDAIAFGATEHPVQLVAGPPAFGGAPAQSYGQPAAPGGTTYPSPYEAQWRQYDQSKAAMAQARLERAAQALGAESAVDLKRSAGGPPAAASNSPLAGLLSALQTPPAPVNAPPAAPLQRTSGDQREGFYSGARLEAPRSATELKAGTVIPAVMVGGVNSDLPGQVVGQVTRNVYDTVTGRYLLIPQGSKLIGTYDSDVAYGQSRMLVAWNRLILPDGSSLDLGSSPGADQGGYAGFRDKANNHYRRTFGSALLVSMFSAGMQLSQPQAANGENITPGQTATAALGQEMGQLGMEMATRNLNIKPELIVRPGYRFNVQVTRDLIMQEWRRS